MPRQCKPACCCPACVANISTNSTSQEACLLLFQVMSISGYYCTVCSICQHVKSTPARKYAIQHTSIAITLFGHQHLCRKYLGVFPNTPEPRLTANMGGPHKPLLHAQLTPSLGQLFTSMWSCRCDKHLACGQLLLIPSWP